MKFQAMNNLIELFLQNYHIDNVLQQNLKVYEFFFNFSPVYCDSNDVKVFCMYILKLPVYCGIDHVKLFYMYI